MHDLSLVMSLNGALPTWIEQGYTTLLGHFDTNPFRQDDAKKVLLEAAKDSPDKVPVLLSRLRKAGLLTVTPEENDARKKIYTLVRRDAIVSEIFDVDNATLTRSDLESLLKRAADIIRTRVDYKFILLPLFLKRISDKWELEFEEAYSDALKDGYSKEEARGEAKRAMYHDFDLPDEYMWEILRKSVDNLPEVFSKALKEIAERNPELRDVLDTVDFIEFAKSPENAEILRQLVELFSEKKLHHVMPAIPAGANYALSCFHPLENYPKVESSRIRYRFRMRQIVMSRKTDGKS